jgi:hypothetical protein
MSSPLPTEDVLASRALTAGGETLGHSRQGREIVGHAFGNGPIRISLIAGCHADEPVGPEMLRRLVSYLSSLRDDAPLLTHWSWAIVPDANPDGALLNAAWSENKISLEDSSAREAEGYDLAPYFLKAIRELPGDDVEFGFPRDPEDRGARPENLAVASFLDRQGPIDLHASFHGMGFAAGPWFLLDQAWTERTVDLQRNLTEKVHEMGYRLHDVDRRGEKGFHRIAKGFTTRPDSRSMIRHFQDLGDESMAALFRPSSMEYVRRDGQDALTLVSEMPLFLLPPDDERVADGPPMPTGTEARIEFFAWGRSLIEAGKDEEFRKEVQRIGIRPMPISDQIRLQLAFLEQGLETLEAGSRRSAG